MHSEKKPRLHKDWIDRDASQIVEILQRKGHTTYLVGGCVRDLLVGLRPKDYDIATTALPRDIKKLIHQSYIIGKRFRLVLVRRQDRQYEVATFRKNFDPADFPDGAPDGDNIFGTPEEDAARRDFTINALFYDPGKDDLIDYNDGLKDIETRSLRVIGVPYERMVEDPIRILRAIRLSHKLGFSLETELRQAIVDSAHTLPESVLPRRREEILKIMRLPQPGLVFQEMYDLGVLAHLSPTLSFIFNEPEKRELFLSYIERCSCVVCDFDSPTELFGLIVLAYARCKFPDRTSINANRFLENEENMELLKNELGLFKYEQSLVARALQVCHSLEKTEEFRRKGHRRQMAVLKTDSFPLALMMAQYDYLLSSQDLHFWHEAYDKAYPEIQREKDAEKAERAKKRSWKKKKPRRSQSPQES